MDELRQNVAPENNLVIAMCATKCDVASNPDTSQAEALAAATGVQLKASAIAKYFKKLGISRKKKSARV